MGISFYYAVPILWRAFDRKLYNKKSPKTNLRTFCGMDETRTRDPLRDRQVF